MKRFLSLLLMSMALSSAEKNWVVYYGSEAPIQAFNPFNLIVLDPSEGIEVKALRERNKLLLGYLSLGEVEEYRWYFDEVKKEGLLGKENSNWKGSYFVNLGNPKWGKRVVEELIPAILHQGFQGIFLDTLDNAEEKDLKAAAALVRQIRLHYPEIKIMVNRAYALVQEVGDQVDMLLAEDLLTSYDFEKKQYLLKSDEEIEKERGTLQTIKEKYPELGFYSLDYWDPKDIERVKSLYERARKMGFDPYVATIDLNKIVNEPK